MTDTVRRLLQDIDGFSSWTVYKIEMCMDRHYNVAPLEAELKKRVGSGIYVRIPHFPAYDKRSVVEVEYVAEAHLLDVAAQTIVNALRQIRDDVSKAVRDIELLKLVK